MNESPSVRYLHHYFKLIKRCMFVKTSVKNWALASFVIILHFCRIVVVLCRLVYCIKMVVGGLQTVVLKVAMSCQGCVGAVNRVLGKMEGLLFSARSLFISVLEETYCMLFILLFFIFL